MITTTVLVLAALAFVILVFVRAWINSVLPMYWGLGAAVIGLASGLIIFQFAPILIENYAPALPVSQTILAAIALLIGLIIYIVSRQILKAILNSVFNVDSFLHNLIDGFFGGVLSLIPSFATVILLSLAIRTLGTLKELSHYEKVAQESIEIGPRNYPKWSKAIEYRDAMEKLPYFTQIYDFVDPISRVAKRKLVALLLCERKSELKTSLAATPDLAKIYDNKAYNELLTNKDLRELLKQKKHLSLLSNDEIRQAAHDPELRKLLLEINLNQLLDNFFNSEQRIKDLESFDKGQIILK